jgi:cell division protein FtsQ
VILFGVVAVSVAWVGYTLGRFLRSSPEMALIHPEQIEISGNHYASRSSVLSVFSPDRGRSILRIPLGERRYQLEAIPWVEQATVRRALPNHIEVEIDERKPIAFLRLDGDLALVDSHGVILDRPLKGSFHFPVVTGILPDMAPEDRERRMLLFSGFMQQVESARPGASSQVSEVDISDVNDLRAMLEGLVGPGGADPAQIKDPPILVHFGDSDFESKYRNLAENIGQYRARAGRLESLDLRFNGEVVANSDSSGPEAQHQGSSKRPAVKQGR